MNMVAVTDGLTAVKPDLCLPLFFGLVMMTEA